MKCGCHSHNGFVLSPEGLAQRAQEHCDFHTVGLTRGDIRFRLDLPVSVSGLIEIENDFEYDPDHKELNRRLVHNGS